MAKHNFSKEQIAVAEAAIYKYLCEAAPHMPEKERRKMAHAQAA